MNSVNYEIKVREKLYMCHINQMFHTSHLDVVGSSCEGLDVVGSSCEDLDVVDVSCEHQRPVFPTRGQKHKMNEKLKKGSKKKIHRYGYHE